MTEADLARWEAQSNADSAPGMHEELLACIAEVRRLRAAIAAHDARGCWHIWTSPATAGGMTMKIAKIVKIDDEIR